jgi:hypothetical protein
MIQFLRRPLFPLALESDIRVDAQVDLKIRRWGERGNNVSEHAPRHVRIPVLQLHDAVDAIPVEDKELRVGARRTAAQTHAGGDR